MPKDVRIVLWSGAGGGIVSWAFTILTGSTFGLSRWGALPLAIILGAAAALIAVYVVIPADVTKTGKLIAFALLCGFLWKPVLDAGRLVIAQRLEASQVKTEVQSHIEELKKAQPQAIPVKAHETADATSELLRVSEHLGNPKVEEEASHQAAEAVNVIGQTSTADPKSAAVALQQIVYAAQDVGNSDVAQLASTRVAAIQQSTQSHATVEPRTESRVDSHRQ